MHTFITRDRFTYAAKVILLGLILGLGIQFAWSWTVPTEAPPGGNVKAPISVSNEYQWKESGITLNEGWDSNGDTIIDQFSVNGLIIPYGNVGIGTTNPTLNLEVVGAVKADGYCLAGKCISKWPESVLNPGTTPPEGYTEQAVNIGEDLYGSTQVTSVSSINFYAPADTCDGKAGDYTCPANATKTCVDQLESYTSPTCGGDNACNTDFYYRNVSCSVSIGLVKNVVPTVANFTCGGNGDCTTAGFNACSYLGKSSLSGDNFSLTTRQYGATWSINPAVGSDGWYTTTTSFTFGTPKTFGPTALNGGSKKHCVTHFYDGNCIITARVSYCGDNTQSSIYNALEFISVN